MNLLNKKLYNKLLANTILLIGSVFLIGCGSSGGSDEQVSENESPLADAGIDQSIDENSTVTLSGSGSDAEGSVTFSWTQSAGASVVLNSADTTIASFLAPDVDVNTVLEFTLTVTDNSGATSTDNVVITILDLTPANTPPNANAGTDQTVDENQTVTLLGSGSDAEGEVTFQWLQTAGTTVEINNSGTAEASFFAPDLSTDSEYTFELTVTDQGGLSASDSVNVMVVNVPDGSGSFNRRIKTIRIDYDNNGIYEGLITSNYNPDGTQDTGLFTYTDDGTEDLVAVAAGEVTTTHTYTVDGYLELRREQSIDSAVETRFEWISAGKASSTNRKRFNMGSLESETDVSITYSDNKLVSTHSDIPGVIQPSFEELTLEYDNNGVIQSDIFTTQIGPAVAVSRRDFTWNNDGLIEDIRETITEPASDFELNQFYFYENGRLVEVVAIAENAFGAEPVSDSYSHSTNGLLETILSDFGNDGTVEVKFSIEWESGVCLPVISWGLKAFDPITQPIPESLPYAIGDGHVSSQNCARVE